MICLKVAIRYFDYETRIQMMFPTSIYITQVGIKSIYVHRISSSEVEDCKYLVWK